MRLWRSTASVVLAVSCMAAASSAFAYQEAPMLAELVKAGKLPPVDQRVGSEPQVIKPLDSVGTYGGQLRFGLRGSSDHNNILRMVGPQGLLRWNMQFTEVVPNVAKSYEVTPDAKAFTFHLRKGMKWSDGQPFTADDIEFSMADLVLAGTISPTPPRYMANGKPLKFEKLDAETVRFTFEAPYGDFLAELATPLGQHPTLYAKHYCKQFTAKYNPNVAELAKANNLPDWQSLFMAKCAEIEIPPRWGNPDRPTLEPWVMKEPYVGGATRIVIERNPYFWQVDTAGNQLPYIDREVAPIAQDVESLILDAVGGRIDMQIRHLDAPANRPVLAQNREKGGYKFFEGRAPGGSNMVINLNLTHKDPDLRKLFNQRDFRVALSVGMDRKEIIETALLGEGQPWQGGPFEDDPYYNEKLSSQYLQYDPAMANKLLDGIGLDKRGSDGMRLLPSGKPLRFKIDVIPTLQPEWVDMLGMIERQWAKIGVDMDVNPLERTFFFERTSNSNDHDAAVWGSGGNWVPGTIPNQIVPIHFDSRWGIPWVDWYTSGGKKGEEPPPNVKERLKLYDQARATIDPQERIALFRKISDIAADQFEVMGVSKAASTYGIVKTNLVNVPSSMPSSWPYPNPAPTLPQTWYWKQ